MATPLPRDAWLRSIHVFTRENNRGPTASDLSRVHGTTRQNQQLRIAAAVSSGDVVANQSRSAYYPLTCKLSPAARMELRLPTIVYLAWPAVFLLDGTWVHTDDGGVAAATWLRDATGIVAVSPFMNPEWPSTSLEIAGLFAERCDAVVVMDDPLLVGREDVASASRANIGISVVRMVDRAGVHGERDLWLPPLAIPSGK